MHRRRICPPLYRAAVATQWVFEDVTGALRVAAIRLSGEQGHGFV
jgi:hypothetical protein